MGNKRAPELVLTTPNESKWVDFDFSKEVGAGVTITAINTVTFTPTVDSADFSTAITGARARIKVTEGKLTAGVRYQINVVVTTSTNERFEGEGILVA